MGKVRYGTVLYGKVTVRYGKVRRIFFSTLGRGRRVREGVGKGEEDDQKRPMLDTERFDMLSTTTAVCNRFACPHMCVLRSGCRV